MMKARLGANPLILQLPIGAESQFSGVVDLIRMKALRWHEADQGQTFDLTEIPIELGAAAAEAREELVETVASEDDDLLEKYLEGEEITETDLLRGIRLRNVKKQTRPGVMWNGSKESRRPTVARCRY